MTHKNQMLEKWQTVEQSKADVSTERDELVQKMTEQVARDEEHQANSQEMQERIKEI